VQGDDFYRINRVRLGREKGEKETTMGRTEADAGVGDNNTDNSATATNSIDGADTLASAGNGSDLHEYEATATDGGYDHQP
jgi:hypothetical protein